MLGSLTSVARELVTYKLDLVGVRGVRWDKRRTVRAGNCIFIHGKEKKINWEQDLCTPLNSISS
jgi:hypothetical protein